MSFFRDRCALHFHGTPVVLSDSLTDTKWVRRSWWERLFSWPWRPWVAEKPIQVPSRKALEVDAGRISLSGSILSGGSPQPLRQLHMHPEMWREVQEAMPVDPPAPEESWPPPGWPDADEPLSLQKLDKMIDSLGLSDRNAEFPKPQAMIDEQSEVDWNLRIPWGIGSADAAIRTGPDDSWFRPAIDRILGSNLDCGGGRGESEAKPEECAETLPPAREDDD